MAQRIQLRRGTAAEWTAANPVLAVGEPGVETDTGKQKFGDGVSTWNSRPYASKGDKGDQGTPGIADDTSVAQQVTNGTATKAALNATYVQLKQAAKNPDLLIVGSITRNGSDVITSAAVVWPDGTAGTFTTDAIDPSGAINGYHITYGSPATKTYTQPTITRNGNGAATNVPQIVVS